MSVKTIAVGWFLLGVVAPLAAALPKAPRPLQPSSRNDRRPNPSDPPSIPRREPRVARYRPANRAGATATRFLVRRGRADRRPPSGGPIADISETGAVMAPARAPEAV